MIELSEHSTPIGDIRLVTRRGELVALAFLESWPRVERHLTRYFPNDVWSDGAPPQGLVRSLDAYMDVRLDALDALPVQASGTEFQRRVWGAIRKVAPGSQVTYSDLAHAAGASHAVYAVGAACGANPIWLVIPCHRIVRASGDLADYGGGLERKEWLLNHELRHAQP